MQLDFATNNTNKLQEVQAIVDKIKLKEFNSLIKNYSSLNYFLT